MNRTAIEYLDYTWNPVTGCTPVSAGCEHCWAKRMHERGIFGKQGFSEIQLHILRLDEPLRRKKPARIGVCFMGDLFHEGVTITDQERVFRVIVSAPQHTFLVLTKRPGQMAARIPIIKNRIWGAHWTACENVWLGVSIEDQATADERIPLLLKTPAAVRYVSVEPMLGEIRLDQLMVPEGLPPDQERHDGPWTLVWNSLTGERATSPYSSYKFKEKLDWIVVGGESGPGARPLHPDWVRSVRYQCQAAGVPFFFKQWGEWLPQCQGPARGWTAMHNWDQPGCPGLPVHGDCRCSFRVGKKAAGCLLDGREWKEMTGLL